MKYKYRFILEFIRVGFLLFFLLFAMHSYADPIGFSLIRANHTSECISSVGTSIIFNCECSSEIASLTSGPVRASGITFPDVPGSSLTINWTSGNGEKRVVFVKEGTGSITNPSNSTTYTASSTWYSKGSQLGSSGYYCVYNGTASTVSLTDLKDETLYTVLI